MSLLLKVVCVAFSKCYKNKRVDAGVLDVLKLHRNRESIENVDIL